MPYTRLIFLNLLLLVLLRAQTAGAQTSSEPPKYEFRGAWIATVARLDWPTTSTTQDQKAELISMLDELKEAGINAVFFQVRSESDAMYSSDLEPWSYWLTAEQGKAPEPYYDPLEFAIEEAHTRGIELHAWLNPYRADRGSGYPKSAGHVIMTHPEWILTFDNIKILNPGIPEVREYVVSVFADVVERYDVDGIHVDDYFYPYPPDHIEAAEHQGKDQATFAEFGQGFSNIGDWRRANVDSLIQGIQEAVAEVKPEVVWGVSPFGIWKNGVPSGISGLDAYNTIYTDAVGWYDERWIDYLTPQLYWPFAGGQDYGRLAPWWADHAARNNRHIYPGHGLYRSESATFNGSLFRADEIPRQVRYNRNHADIQGSVFFRAQNITRFHSEGFADSLANDLYRYPALTPIMEWRSMQAPPSPEALTFEWTGADEVTLNWTAPAPSKVAAEASFFAVYRLRSSAPPDFSTAVAEARNLLAVTGETTITDRPGIAGDPYYYAVSSVSPNSVESEPGNSISLEGRATSTEDPSHRVSAFSLHQSYPNPFRDVTQIGFTLDKPARVTLRVFNELGQEVSRLVDNDLLTPDTYGVTWDGSNDAGAPLPSGAYFYSLEVAGGRKSGAMVLVR
jgi:uncharacterized lipoprotein YddW (UPF0748 family)